jgi:hypothetical protein
MIWHRNYHDLREDYINDILRVRAKSAVNLCLVFLRVEAGKKKKRFDSNVVTNLLRKKSLLQFECFLSLDSSEMKFDSTLRNKKLNSLLYVFNSFIFSTED